MIATPKVQQQKNRRGVGFHRLLKIRITIKHRVEQKVDLLHLTNPPLFRKKQDIARNNRNFCEWTNMIKSG